MTVGIDLGNYRTTVMSHQVEWSALADRQHHFLSWVTTENNGAIVGDAVLSLADIHGYDGVYARFISDIEQTDQTYLVAGRNVECFDLINFIFKKTSTVSHASAEDVILAVPENFQNNQKLAVVACAQKQGVKVKAVLTQSLAKAVALAHREKFKLGTLFAIYDWEDSGFNFSIYRVISRYGLEVIASQYLDQVGQFACEQRLWELLAEEYKTARGRELTEHVLSKQHPDLKDCKNNLEKYGKASIEIRQTNLDVSFSAFDEQTQDLVKQSLNKVDQAFHQAKITEADLTGGVFIFGIASQSNLDHHTMSIMEPVKKYFTCSIKLEEGLGLTAKGAALFGEYYLSSTAEDRLQFTNLHNNSILYMDRAQHYYGVVTSIYDAQLQADKDQNYPLIAKDQTLPIRYETTLHTDESGQTQIDFQFTIAAVNTNQIEHVQRLPIQQIEFSNSSSGLVELSLILSLDVEHSIHCKVHNQFTGETREIRLLDPVIGKYQHWRDSLIAVQ